MKKKKTTQEHFFRHWLFTMLRTADQLMVISIYRLHKTIGIRSYFAMELIHSLVAYEDAGYDPDKIAQYEKGIRLAFIATNWGRAEMDVEEMEELMTPQYEEDIARTVERLRDQPVDDDNFWANQLIGVIRQEAKDMLRFSSDYLVFNKK